MSDQPPFATVTEANIVRLVDAFYALVRSDTQLAPVFESRIKGNWEPHLARMYLFWSSVMLSSAAYKGNPVGKHVALDGLSRELFTRWLELFAETTNELFSPELAKQFQAKAANIAQSLQFMIFEWLPQNTMPRPVRRTASVAEPEVPGATKSQ